jgi:hypothetical protein
MLDGPGAKTGRAHAGARRRAVAGLEQARAFFAAAERRPIAFEHLAEGLERTYRKARKAFREAYRRPTDEAFHAWRKSVQQHWRHMQLLSRCWPEILGGRAGEAKELSRLLGDDHDLAVLAVLATGRGGKVLAEDERRRLADACRSCQDELRALAKPRGDRLLAESARDLGERVAGYWKAAARLSALAAAKQSGAHVAATSKGRRASLSPKGAASRGRSGSRTPRPPGR